MKLTIIGIQVALIILQMYLLFKPNQTFKQELVGHSLCIPMIILTMVVVLL